MVPVMRGLRIGLVILALAAGGCLGRGYARVMSVHVEVLESMARKLCAMAQGGQAPPTEAMPASLARCATSCVSICDVVGVRVGRGGGRRRRDAGSCAR
jgi:hypothetical protein